MHRSPFVGSTDSGTSFSTEAASAARPSKQPCELQLLLLERASTVLPTRTSHQAGSPSKPQLVRCSSWHGPVGRAHRRLQLCWSDTQQVAGHRKRRAKSKRTPASFTASGGSGYSFAAAQTYALPGSL